MAIETLYSEEMAEWYDLMYCDAETTAKQIRLLRQLFRKHSVESILDVACGTGCQAIELAQAGYRVAGIDIEPGMLAHARKKARGLGLAISFRKQDMRRINVREKFDAAIIFSTSLAYLTTNDDVIKSLESVNRHLRRGGVLIIDTFFAWPHMVAGSLKGKVIDSVKHDDRTYQVTDENKLALTTNYLYVNSTHERKVGSKRLRTLADKRPTKLRLFLPNELELFFQFTGFTLEGFLGDLEGHKLSDKHHRRLIAIAIKK